MNGNKWKMVLKVIVAVATALLGALGVSSQM
ncbi:MULTISPECIES: smalltalk protein [unclassified Prevotella]|nr:MULTISPECIES: smalltalk protein [unclassified Prevotella]